MMLAICSIHKTVLDELGVQSVMAIIGGSMGGMHALEWPLCTPAEYVKNIIPIATSAYQGAWGISWGETRRQATFSDASFRDGWYEPVPECQPRSGLGVARMVGMLTYCSFDSFEARFGRRAAAPAKQRIPTEALPTPPLSDNESTTPNMNETENGTSPSLFSAQGYLQYQADRFLDRFDANCYLHLTKKMNTHDITRDRDPGRSSNQTPTLRDLTKTLNAAPEGSLVIGVESDLLFPLQQQAVIAQCLPSATFETLSSRDGHDGFLLEFERLNHLIQRHLNKRFPQLYEGPASLKVIDFDAPVANSVFGEVENVRY
jgi:homoserine O-acetyltransferase